MSEDKDWCPTMGGEFTGYIPEYLHGDRWVCVPFNRNGNGIGVKYPLLNGGILATLDLMSHAQAQTVAWAYKTEVEANGERAQIRIQPYKVLFDLKARKTDDVLDIEREWDQP